MDCVCNFSIKEGESALELELFNGVHMWTPIQVKQPKLCWMSLVNLFKS